MSVFGEPSIDEVRHQMRTVEFRRERVDAMATQLPFGPGSVALIRDWNTWSERWAVARDGVLKSLLGRKLARPLLPDSMIQASPEMERVLRATGTPKETIALSPLIHRFEAATGQDFDNEGAPVPSGFDPDHAAYKAVDEKVKAAEAAAAAARDSAGEAASSNTGLLVLGGLGILVGGWIVAKVYL